MDIVHGVREYLTPVLKKSAFVEKGVLTPAEFVAAGDQLVFKCPTWQWGKEEEGSGVAWLPPGKQFLITKHVPCLQRARAMAVDAMEKEVEGEDGWLEAESKSSKGPTGVAPTDEFEMIGSSSEGGEAGAVGGGGGGGGGGLLAFVREDHVGASSEAAAPPASATPAPAPAPAPAVVEEDSDDDYVDLADFDDDNLLVEDESALKPAEVAAPAPVPAAETKEGDAPMLTAVEPEESRLIHTRTYDVHITYDKYHQTPRVFLRGFSEKGDMLKPKDIFEDIMPDYVNETVTIAKHPHLPSAGPVASIHPCRHAATMKSFLTAIAKGGGEVRADQYLFLFLKFIQSVIPTIDYDYTRL